MKKAGERKHWFYLFWIRPKKHPIVRANLWILSNKYACKKEFTLKLELKLKIRAINEPSKELWRKCSIKHLPNIQYPILIYQPRPKGQFQILYKKNKEPIMNKWWAFTTKLINPLIFKYQICSEQNVCFIKFRISTNVLINWKEKFRKTDSLSCLSWITDS